MKVGLVPLRRLVESIFVAAGCPDDEAQRISLYLSKANLTGHDSHGVIRVPRYVEYIEDGRVKVGKHLSVVLDTPAITIVDGEHGFGQTIGPEACKMGIAKAKANGVALVAIRRAGHLGRIGDFSEMAVAEGIVSLHFVNAYNSGLVAPFGGRGRKLSTNPISIGVPSGDDRPFILDFATSVVAEGKVLVAHQGGKPIPDNALVGPDGTITGDPAVLYGPSAGGYPDPRKGPGAMRAFGEHKGSGLSIACDLLAGALTGSGSSDDPDGLFHNGMLSIYIDPKFLDDRSSFADDVHACIDRMRASAPMDPAEPVMIPGDKERKTWAERSADGIPLSDETWAAILATARRKGLTQERIDQLLAP